MWPITLWGVAFAAHYFYSKARTADERWVEERTAELRSKSYDASHIDSITERYEERSAPDKPGQPK